MRNRISIAVLGGTGPEGSGLAFRWALHGHDVILGSRNVDKALAAAQALNALLAGRAHVRGAANANAAGEAQIVVLTVPFSAQLETAEVVAAQLHGKILVDVTVPLAHPVDRVHLPNGESAVLALQRILGERVQVVAAFQNVSATHLKDAAHEIDCDVLVCGNDRVAREQVVNLARDAGMRALHAGVLANSAAIEAMTSVLIAINKHYKVPASGLRITGVLLESRDSTIKPATP